jgi:lipoprotein-anchoring transpeptidase ErfK/SrfK
MEVTSSRDGLTFAHFKIGCGRKGIYDKVTCTPAGEFKVISKAEDPWYRDVGEDAEWIRPYKDDKRNKYGTRIIVLNYARKKGSRRLSIHGTNEPEILPGYISAMCIRIKNEEVEWLYNLINIGDTIVIK